MNFAFELTLQSIAEMPYDVFAMFLLRHADSDYIAMRLLYYYENRFIAENILQRGAECIEKVLKSYCLIESIFNTKEIKKKGHDIEKIREQCAMQDDFFAFPELTTFCKTYSQKLSGVQGNQALRYGLSDVVAGYSGNTSKMVELVDKVFIGTLVRLNNTMLLHSSVAVVYSDIVDDVIFNLKTKRKIKRIINKNNNQIQSLKSICKTLSL
jgi:hypothetical protein